jgi:hypothetical protein
MDQPTTDATTWLLFTESLPLSRPALLPGPGMPGPGLPRTAPGLSRPGPARPTRPGLPQADRGGSVIVLADRQSGGERLGALLAADPSLACTAGTGILELCEQAAKTWRGAERTGSTLSALGAASVRAMAGTMLAMIKSQAGARRWCETSAAPPRLARTFGQLYPELRIICLHRGCPGYIAACSCDDPAADADQWLARTEALLELERDRPGQCLRVRHEDLAASPDAADGVLAFLGLAGRPADPGQPGHQPPVPGLPGRRPAAAWLPGRWLTPAVRGEINRLHAELGYPPVTGC